MIEPRSVDLPPVAEAPWVAFVGPFTFPWGQPGSRRVLGLARSLATAGLRVVVASGESGNGRPMPLPEAEGVRYCGTGELPGANASRFAKVRWLTWSQGAAAIRWLDRQERPPSHVVAYGCHAPFMARLQRWCRRRGVALVADVVEWYQGNHMGGGVLGPYHLSAKYALLHQYTRCAGIIAISEYLERHYVARGVACVRVPPTLDVMATTWRAGTGGPEGPLQLVYAGSPGKKDLLGNVIRGLASVDAAGEAVCLSVYGPSRDEVRGLLGKGEPLPKAVTVMGRVAQADIEEALRRADFSVLLREPRRFAQAGFPTKVPESMAVGTPVICNLTSDLSRYVRDGVSGVVASDFSPAAFADALRRVVALSAAGRAAMRAEARAAAERSFDFRVHSDPMRRFLEGVRP